MAKYHHPSSASQKEIDNLLSFVPEGEKHKRFRSMNSSQALAQSILGNTSVVFWI